MIAFVIYRLRRALMLACCRIKSVITNIILTLTNCTGDPLVSLDITGNSTQDSTTGRNLFDINNLSFTTSINTGAYEVLSTGLRVYNTTSNMYASVGFTLSVTPNTNYRLSYAPIVTSGAYQANARDGGGAMLVETNVYTYLTFNSGDYETIAVRFYSTSGTAALGDVLYSDIMLKEGTTSATYEPYTGGVPAPNPDYPYDIFSVGDLATSADSDWNTPIQYGKTAWVGTAPSALGADAYRVPVTVRGKNLFNPKPWATATTQSGLTIQYLESEDCFVINGTAAITGNYRALYINLRGIKGQAYRLSNKYVGGTVTRPNGTEYALSYLGASDVPNTSNNWLSANLNQGDSNEGRVLNYNYITMFWFFISAGVSFNNYKVKIQIELGSVATEYEPYHPPQSFNSYLNAPLRGLPDGTKDTYDAVTGQITRRVGVKLCDGSENLSNIAYYEDTGLYSIAIPKPVDAGGVNTWGNKIICTHEQNKEKSLGNKTNIYQGSSTFAWTYDPNVINATSIPEFATYLENQHSAGTPVTIYYELAEPIIETAVPISLPTYHGTTIIQLDTTTQPAVMEAEYWATEEES